MVFSPIPQSCNLNAMDQTHDENFKLPDIEKQTAEEKISGALLGAIVVGGVVTAGVVMGFLIKDKL